MSAVQKHLKAASAGLVRSSAAGFSKTASPSTTLMLTREKTGLDHTQKLAL
jgi:hypothetical protein